MNFLKDYIRYVRQYRQGFLDSKIFSEELFICPNCGKAKPFGGDDAVGYYNDGRGCIIVCNDCLLEFESRF